MRASREHWPLLKVVFAAILTFLVFAASGQGDTGFSPLHTNVAWFAFGVIYTHLFEYCYHRIGMHYFYDGRHLKHHQIFNGENFQSRKPSELQEISTEWYIFPILFTLHYVIFSFAAPLRFARPFFLGVTIQFLIYETTHWFTHVKDNRFDRSLSRIPVLGSIREWQIEHHRIHHEVPAISHHPMAEIVCAEQPRENLSPAFAEIHLPEGTVLLTRTKRNKENRQTGRR